MLTEQSVRDMQAVVRVDADQMCIEGSMMDFRQRNTVGESPVGRAVHPYPK